MIFKEPVPCPVCGKKAKKRTESFWSSAGEDYTGNLRVIRDKSLISKDEDGNPTGKITHLVLWDGESYSHFTGHFCTNRCAIKFANASWNNLLRSRGNE